jgi:NADPH-dependent 2,4-dienoyl-CoA reductase/sulfur reductase-like enzyme
MNIVVIGGGLAGASAVEELRSQGYPGDLTLVGSETHLPYERPPLSKAVLLGTAEPESAVLHDAAWYDELGVDVLLGTPARSIDLDRGKVTLADRELSYDRLLLATGATPRRLPALDGEDLPVAYLRTLDDARLIRERLAGRVVIVGAGWIGLEVAAAARTAGADVTVIERAGQPLEAALGAEVGALFADLHREHGVDLRLDTAVDTDDLRDADLVVVGVGAVPCDELAAAAGLACDNGVLVDAWLRTEDPHVYAAGDVARQNHPVLGSLRVEHWDAAIHQGRAAARAMLGDDDAYDRMPYFFTDQYDLGMEYVGHVGPAGYDEVVIRGDRADRKLVAYWLRAGRVVAGMHLNDWDAIETIRSVVGGPLPEDLREEDTRPGATRPA